MVANSPISLLILSRNSSLVSSLRAQSDERELLREQILFGEIVERGNQLALGQIAGGAKDHHDAGIAGAAGAGSVSGCSSLFCDLHF